MMISRLEAALARADSPSTLESRVMKKSTPDNGPASDDMPPAPNAAKGKNGKLKNPKGKDKANWVSTFRCFHCGKHGHKLPQCFKGNGLNHKAPTSHY